MIAAQIQREISRTAATMINTRCVPFRKGVPDFFIIRTAIIMIAMLTDNQVRCVGLKFGVPRTPSGKSD